METGTASLVTVGLAASDLWEMRTGRRQIFSVDTRRATVVKQSSNFHVEPLPWARIGLLSLGIRLDFPHEHGII